MKGHLLISGELLLSLSVEAISVSLQGEFDVVSKSTIKAGAVEAPEEVTTLSLRQLDVLKNP